MSINFILQSIRLLHIGEYTNGDIETIYNFVINLDNKDLISYFTTNNVLSYNNDLELYIEILDSLIKIFESDEKYEECSDLMSQKHKALLIIKEKNKQLC